MVKLKPKRKMQPVGDRRVTVLVGLGTALTSLALTVISSAMGSTNWVTVTVDRAAIASLADDYVTVSANGSGSSLIDALYNDRLYFSRSRGLFQTCYDHDSQIFSGENQPASAQVCIRETGYGASNSTSQAYIIRSHLMRSYLAAFVLALLFLFVVAVLGMLTCCANNLGRIKAAGALAIFAGFFDASGIGLWHYCRYLEHTAIFMYPFEFYYENSPEYDILLAHSRTSLGYSYILMGCGACLSIIVAIFYLVAACLSCGCGHNMTAAGNHSNIPLHEPNQQNVVTANQTPAPRSGEEQTAVYSTQVPISREQVSANQTQAAEARSPYDTTLPYDWHYELGYDWKTFSPYKTFYEVPTNSSDE